MSAFGIPLRDSAAQVLRNKGQMAFGERLTKQGVTAHKGQEGAIKLMIQLRSRDYSYRMIAAELDRREIPTKTGNGQWKATTVMKICKRPQKNL